jgi:hypothetical protein
MAHLLEERKRIVPVLPGSDEIVSGGPTGPRKGGGGEGRAVVTLTPAVAGAVRRMGEEMGEASPTEVVRRGLIMLDLMLSLPDDEELVIRNRKTQQIERLRFAWDTF